MSLALRRWWPDLLAFLVVAAYGLWEAHKLLLVDQSRLRYVLLSLGIALAVGLVRATPMGALVLVWVIGAVQVLTGTDVIFVEVAIAVVAFGTARWGRAATVWTSGLSIPLGGLIGGHYVYGEHGTTVLSGLVRGSQGERLLQYGFSYPTLAVLVGLALLGAPWLAGLALRALARARRSEVGQEAAEAEAARARRETEQAQEIARLRDEQARLARDVHDVVGHSLAVILAQAESGQYLPDDDPEKLKATMTTIATSARSSLQDVRQVLTPPGGAPVPPRDGGIEELLAGVRAGGHAVDLTEVGTPRPLPPELEVVAHRVVQEMLTNAIKHGRRDRPVLVERSWPAGEGQHDLRIEVRNVEQATDETQPIQAADGPPGQGLIGMQRRLDSVGGRLDVRRHSEPDGPTFTATAWVPVRSR